MTNKELIAKKAQAIIECHINGLMACLNIIASDMSQLAKEVLIHTTWEATKTQVWMIHSQPIERFKDDEQTNSP